MTVLDQSNFKGEYRRPGRTYPRFRIKRTPDGFVWLSRKKKVLTKPAATKSEAKRLAKAKLKAIKLSKRTKGKKN
jgi:hypothetical protein